MSERPLFSFSLFPILGYFLIVIMTLPILAYPYWILQDVIVSHGGENIISAMFTDGYIGFPYMMMLIGIGFTVMFFVSKMLYRRKLLNVRSHFILSLISAFLFVSFLVYQYYLRLTDVPLV